MTVSIPTPVPSGVKIATAVYRASNRKLSVNREVSATYTSQISCHPGCPWRGSGCYAEQGLTAFTTNRLNRAAVNLEVTPRDVAIAEASAIDNLRGTLPLRLHVVGDCPDAETSGIVAQAAERYRTRTGAPVWTYTHTPDVPRQVWGSVSILRSCDTPDQIPGEHERGYACALVVPDKFTNNRLVDCGGGFRGIPCPQQTGTKPDCVSCRLCWRDGYLHSNRLVILFQPDGRTEGKIRDAKRRLADPGARGIRLPMAT